MLFVYHPLLFCSHGDAVRISGTEMQSEYQGGSGKESTEGKTVRSLTVVNNLTLKEKN
jgi:hypothetical protein